MIQVRATEYKHYIQNKTKVMGDPIRLAIDENCKRQRFKTLYSLCCTLQPHEYFVTTNIYLILSQLQHREYSQ